MTRVVVLADVRIYRDGLQELLRRDGRLQPITVASVEQVRAVVSDLQPSALLLAVPRSDSLGTIEDLLDGCPDLKLIVVGIAEQANVVLSWMKMGIHGLVGCESTHEDLVEVVEAALATGEITCCRPLSTVLYRATANRRSPARTLTGLDRLTRRELQILRLLDEGLTNKEIARRLTISVATVKNHVQNVLAKLGVHRRGEAAAWARRAGLV